MENLVTFFGIVKTQDDLFARAENGFIKRRPDINHAPLHKSAAAFSPADAGPVGSRQRGLQAQRLFGDGIGRNVPLRIRDFQRIRRTPIRRMNDGTSILQVEPLRILHPAFHFRPDRPAGYGLPR